MLEIEVLANISNVNLESVWFKRYVSGKGFNPLKRYGYG